MNENQLSRRGLLASFLVGLFGSFGTGLAALIGTCGAAEGGKWIECKRHTRTTIEYDAEGNMITREFDELGRLTKEIICRAKSDVKCYSYPTLGFRAANG